MTFIRPRLTALFAALLLLGGGLLAAPASAQTVLCSGVSKAEVAKCDTSGYADSMAKMHWRMYAGHNCTNYVAYRLGKNGVPEPSRLMGNAIDWASNAKKLGVRVDSTPAVGAIGAWDDKNHLVYVEELGHGYLIVTEDNWGGSFRRIKVASTEKTYPQKFIHFKDLLAAGTPKISGTPATGSTLSAAAGSWLPGDVTLSYQWSRDGAAITGATKASYLVAAADVGRTMSVTVTGKKSGYGTLSATAKLSTAVLPGTLLNSVAPAISGAARVGATLTSNDGSWQPASTVLSRQWLRDGVAIPGATGATLTLTAAEAGSKISTRITGKSNGYTTLIKPSPATAAVALGVIANSTPPKINGKPQVGVPLSVAPGGWTPTGIAYSYQWLAGGAPIAGATAARFVPSTAQLGKPITVEATGNKAGYAPLTVVAASTSPVLGTLSLAAAPSITGKYAVGSLLTGRIGSWNASGTSTSYQWLRAGVPIAGATGPGYRSVAADAGQRLSLRVTGNRPGYSALAKTSASSLIRYESKLSSKAKAQAGQVTFTVVVKAPGLKAQAIAGTVTLKLGKKTVKKAKVRNGKVTLRVAKQKRGSHSYQLSYSGSAKIAGKKLHKKVKVA